ncbi:hypothetical protein F4808DRAFT_338276 [Astrocystis sublimbata]|nr:hypothetical protein F4808DRAFT_338276 [Astrocystis sublimbata]
MQLEKVLFLLTLAATSAAENDVEADDVPRACLPACQFTVDLTQRCDRETDEDDRYRSCVCDAANAQQRTTECASCVKDNDRDPNDSDVADLMEDCGWDFRGADVPYPMTTTVGAPSSTSSGGSGNTVTVTQTPSNTASDSSSETGTPTSDGSTTTGTENPASETSPGDSMAGALNAKTVVGSMLAAFAMVSAIVL